MKMTFQCFVVVGSTTFYVLTRSRHTFGENMLYFQFWCQLIKVTTADFCNHFKMCIPFDDINYHVHIGRVVRLIDIRVN